MRFLAMVLFISLFVFLPLTLALAEEAAENVTPIFSDAEWQAMPKSGNFDFKLVNKDGIMVPRLNGRGLMGVSAGFSNEDIRQLEYEAPILAQQGINHLKMGVRPMNNMLWNDWSKDQRVLQRYGISSVWSYYAMCCEDSFYDRFLGLRDNTLKGKDCVINEDGKKVYFRGAGTLGNYFSPVFWNYTDRVLDKATQSLTLYPTVIGYQYTNEVFAGTGSFDPDARKNWQGFIKSLFKDKTPAADSNGDGVFFNSTFGKNYKTWDEVEQFRGDDWKDSRRSSLRDAWMGLNYARFVDHACARARASRRDLLTGAIVCVPLSPTVDLSLLGTMPNISCAYINTYFGWLGGGQLMEQIAATYHKPAIASEINEAYGDYAAVRWGALTHLPYLEGFEWFYYSWAPKSAGGEHGGKFGFVDKWNIDLTKDHGDGFVGPYKAVEYNSRFAIIPQLAPFVGRLHAGFNHNILWISAGTYPRDWLEDHEESGITRAEVTSDVALALRPNSLDLNKYKVIIYRNLQSPCISRDIYRRLKKFVQNGGTVVTGAYYIAADGTWLGEDNRRDWWQGMKLAHENRTEDGTTTVRYGSHDINIKGTYPYLVSTSSNVQSAGEVSTSTGAKYPFVLTRNEGKGCWVYVNVPYFFQIAEPYEQFSPAKYASRFACLRDVISDYSSETPADRFATQWHAGNDCVLAIREPYPGGGNDAPGKVTGAPWKNGRFVMFEVFDLKTDEGKPYIDVIGGCIKTSYDLKPKEAKLWVVKPYGKPVMLYADGTIKNSAKLDSGTYKNHRLKVRFAERAFVSSPEKPKSLTINGKPYPFTYDPASQIVKIERTGQMVDGVLSW